MLRTLMIIFCIVAFPSVATAQMVDATNPGKMVRIMRSEGYKASLDRASDGDPMITGRLSRSNYIVLFYGCRDGRNCRSITFYASYNKRVSLAFVNNWNKTKRFATAFQDDEGEPIIQMHLNLQYGITRKNFLDNLDWWRITLESFEDELY